MSGGDPVTVADDLVERGRRYRNHNFSPLAGPVGYQLLTELTARIESLTRDLAEARGALEPFAAILATHRERYAKRYGPARMVGEKNFDAMPDDWPMETMPFTMGDFRRAAKALSLIQKDSTR